MHLLFEVVGTPFEVHPRHRGQVGGREAQLLNLLVECLAAHQVGGLRVARHLLVLQPVFLLAVLLLVEGLLLQHPVGTLDNDRLDDIVHLLYHDNAFPEILSHRLVEISIRASAEPTSFLIWRSSSL